MVKEGLNDKAAHEPRPEGKEEWRMLQISWGRGTGKAPRSMFAVQKDQQGGVK